MVWSRRLKKQSILIERRFFQNLRSREVRAEYLGEKKPEYAGRLLSHDLHLADLEIPGESTWAGKTLMELNLGKKYGIHIASILRGKRRINIPDITKMTNNAAIIIRMTIVDTNGARLARLSCHRVINSTEWFFFTMIARRKGEMQRTIEPANRAVFVSPV